MKLSDYIASFLASCGVHHVFEITGGAAVHLIQSISDNKATDYICVQHEQAGAMAAESYARVTKNIGAAMATSGPGMTNLITGIACAYFDSIPVIYITGQVNTYESKQGRKARQIGFQETDIVKMVKDLTKFAVTVSNPFDIRYFLEKAIYIAKSARQGPVLIDVPMDIQRTQINPENLKKFNPEEIKINIDKPSLIEDKITKSLKLIYKAKRPVIIAGGGIRYADQINQFEKLIEKFGFPVVSTWSGIDVLHHNHPLYIGQIGVYGNRGANFTVQNSDLIICFGSRLDTRITGGKPETFARGAKKIIIDIDRAELYKKRGLNPDIGVCAGVKEVINILTNKLVKKQIPDTCDWINKTILWKNKYPAVLPEWRKRKKQVNPYVFIETLSNMLNNNQIVVADCGANLTWTIQAFKVKRGQRLFSAMGNSPMGYSLPASIGASIALNKKPIICIIGDGGLQVNIQEFQTVVKYNIPVKIFILNNHSYGIIKQFQDFYFNSNYVATTPESGYSMPDFLKVANAYGIKSERISNHEEIRSKINKILKVNGPVICDVIIEDTAIIIPKLEFGNPIEDLSPLLPRKEFLNNMIIKPLEVSIHEKNYENIKENV